MKRTDVGFFKNIYIYNIYNISHYVHIWCVRFACTNSLIAFWWKSPASTKRVIFLILEFCFYEKPSKLATCIYNKFHVLRGSSQDPSRPHPAHALNLHTTFISMHVKVWSTWNASYLMYPVQCIYMYTYNIPRHYSRASLKRSWLLIVYISVYISDV